MEPAVEGARVKLLDASRISFACAAPGVVMVVLATTPSALVATTEAEMVWTT